MLKKKKKKKKKRNYTKKVANFDLVVSFFFFVVFNGLLLFCDGTSTSDIQVVSAFVYTQLLLPTLLSLNFSLILTISLPTSIDSLKFLRFSCFLDGESERAKKWRSFQSGGGRTYQPYGYSFAHRSLSVHYGLCLLESRQA